MDTSESLGTIELVLLLGGLVFSFIAIMRVVHKFTVKPAQVDDPPPPRTYPPSLFSRLREYGFTVCAEKDWCTLRLPRMFGYAVCYGSESVYYCRACDQRGKHPFGETTSVHGRQWNRVDWFGVVCRHCGHMERYAGKMDGGGFFGLMLENGDSLLDVIAALDAEGDKPLLEKMERVLTDREGACKAKTEAVASLRKDLAMAATGAVPIPFRSVGKTTSFLS